MKWKGFHSSDSDLVALYDSAYDSAYDSDSDSVASEYQPFLENEKKNKYKITKTNKNKLKKT